MFFYALTVLGLQAQMVECFEQGRKVLYFKQSKELSSGTWEFHDALTGSKKNDKKVDNQSARIRRGSIEMRFDYPSGLAELSFHAATYGQDKGGIIQIEYSQDKGSSWFILKDSVVLNPTLTLYQIPAQIVGNVRIRIANIGKGRVNVDCVKLIGLRAPAIIAQPHYEVSATANSITFRWETEGLAQSIVRFGKTAALELGEVIEPSPKTAHKFTLSNLEPAEAYSIQLRATGGLDTTATAVYICGTASPVETTGQIHTYFNKSVDHTLATFGLANGDVDLANVLNQHIRLAEKTVELAFYNITGGVGERLIQELIDAKERGVEVRLIMSGHRETENPLIKRLHHAGINAVYSLGKQQMHNKFAVIDAHHSNPTKGWVITGSWNATDSGTYQQYQNVLAIQDVALARGYLLEFNQMWGASMGAFNPSNAKFSSSKSVVNPSVYWVGSDSTRIELYFSPQGNTESHILRTIQSAERDINLTLNLITRKTISDALQAKHNEGVIVRGTVGEPNLTGSVFNSLSSWADVHHFVQKEHGLLHHKYTVIDGEVTSKNSKVLTGSHNWSLNANTKNDENTLILFNERVVNEFFQEFVARYHQVGGKQQYVKE